MAASQGSLSARLTLTGQDDLKRSLDNVGESGDKNFSKVHASAEHAGEGLGELHETVETVEGAFEQLGGFGALGGVGELMERVLVSARGLASGLGGLLTVTAAVGAGFFALAKEGAEWGSALQEGANRVGVAAQDYATLSFALSRSGGSADDFEKAMGKILEASGAAGEGASKVEAGASKIEAADQKVAQSSDNLVEVWRRRNDTLSESALHTADDLKEIQLRYDKQRIAAADLTGAQLEAAQKRNDDDRLEAIRLLNKRVAETRRLADKQLAEDLEKARQDRIKQQEKELADYYKNIDAQNDQFFHSTKDKFSQFGIDLKTAQGKARDPAQVFRDIVDKLEEMPDGAERAAKAIDLFGRRIGSRLTESLSAGKKGLEELEQEARDLNLVPGTDELKQAKAFGDTVGKIGDVIKATAGRVGIALIPLFFDFGEALAKALASVQPTLLSWAKTIVELLKPLFEDLTAALTGDTDKIKSQFVFVLVRAVQYFVEAVKIAASMVGDVLKGMAFAFNAVDTVVQALFAGASLGGIAGFLVALRGVLTVVSLLDFAISALVTGPLVLLAGSLASIVTTMTSIAAVIGWPALLVAALVILVAALAGLTPVLDTAKSNFAALWELIKALGGWFARQFVDSLNGTAAAFKSAWETIYYWVSYYVGLAINAVNGLFDKIKAVLQAIGVLGGSGGSGVVATADIPAQGLAGGGEVHGRGTSTSDSIWARLSNGEFVMKARAVKYWGLSMMRSLNNMVQPKGFAAGGYVDALGGVMNSGAARGVGGALYASAAAVEGRIAVDLSHNGRTFYGLLAPARVAAAMERYASSQQRVSLGRRPTAFGAAAI